MKTHSLSISLLLLLLTVAACDSVDDNEDHPEPAAIRLVSVDETVYEFDLDDGTVSCDITTCGIDIAMDNAVRVEIHLLDDDGNVIPEEEVEEGVTFTAQTSDPDVATVVQPTAAEPYVFTVNGVGIGTTDLEVTLWHNEHEDAGTPPLGTSNAVSVRVAEVVKQ